MGTMEKSMHKQFSVDSIMKQVARKNLSLGYVLQRGGGRWSLFDKSNQISDMCQNNPMGLLIFTERVYEDGRVIIYAIDGKQRLTNTMEFMSDGFRISKKVIRYNMEYFEGGEHKEFDIRGRKFSEFPEVLQDKLRDYTFEVTQYINCSAEEMEYHMMRYNRGVKMNTSEKSIVALGEEKTAMLRGVYDNLFFSLDHDNFTGNEHKTGSVLRSIAESVMAVNYLDNWKDNKTEETCTFLRENATEDNFDLIDDYATELDAVLSEDIRKAFFNVKYGFLFFALFHKFKEYGVADSKFADFLEELRGDLGNKTVGDNVDSWNEISVDTHHRNTGMVHKRLSLLETLLSDFLGVKEETALEFIQREVSEDFEEEDMDLFESSLEDYMVEVSEDSVLRNRCNRKALLALVAYSWQVDIDMSSWLKSKNNKQNSFSDSVVSYSTMKADFDCFYNKASAA